MLLYTTCQLRLNKACSFRDPYDLTVNIRYELAIKDCDAIIHDVSGWLNKACSFTDPYDLTVNIRYELAIKDYGFYYTRLSLGSTKPAVAETLTIELGTRVGHQGL